MELSVKRQQLLCVSDACGAIVKLQNKSVERGFISCQVCNLAATVSLEHIAQLLDLVNLR